MAKTTVTIATKDGNCPASVFTPEGGGPWPAVIVYMDGVGYRPAVFEIAERIAKRGYYVLVPDLFYRAGPYEAPDPKKLFGDPDFLATWRAKFIGSVTQASAKEDTRAFLDFLASQPQVKPGKIGTTGYCMGGGLSLAMAGHYPDHIAAAASYHGGRLATDAPDSPHLLAPKMRARVYVGGAIEDASFPDDQKARLEKALADAAVTHTVETYAGCKHGWVPSDTPVHSPEGAKRHDETLFALLSCLGT